MWKFNLEWLNEDGKTCRDTGQAEAEQLDEWVRVINEANSIKSLHAWVEIPTQNDSDWGTGRIPALRVKKIDIIAGPTWSW